MKSIIIKIAIVTTILASSEAHSQGFVNLDFEDATIVPVNPQFPQYVYANTAIPGWAAYLGGTSQGGIYYDTVSAGGAGIFLEDSNNNSPKPIQGLYSMYFVGDYNPGSTSGLTSEIAQTGVVPATAQSLIFWGNLSGVDLLLNGQSIPYAVIGNGNNYSIYQADISGYAGQTAMLEFLALVNGGGLLDNIQFSSTSVPEPSEFALGALGAILLGFRRWRNSSR